MHGGLHPRHRRPCVRCLQAGSPARAQRAHRPGRDRRGIRAAWTRVHRRQLPVQHPRQRRRHLQPATAGDHHPAGVDRRHHRRRRDTGDHHRRHRLVVGFGRRRDRDDCDELRAGEHLSACRLPEPDGHAGHCSSRRRPRVRPDRRADQRPAGRLYKNSVVHRHPRHDGDGTRRSQMVVEGPADLVSRPNPSRGSARASCPF